MQRVLVILAVVLLVTASLGVGALAANWPFWRRASVWHDAEGGWPPALPGPHLELHGGAATAMQFDEPRADLAAAAAAGSTQLLMRITAAGADAWFAPGFDADTKLNGRGLTPLLLVALYDELVATDAGLLERGIGAWLPMWRQDVRGGTTPAQLLDLVAGGIAAAPAASQFNPFGSRARLLSGPDYEAAARTLFKPGDPARAAAAAQLLGSVAGGIGGASVAEVLQDFWAGLAAGDARLPQDRRRGVPALHCCLEATAADWLRLGSRLGAGAGTGLRAASSEGREIVAGQGGAVLWSGEGKPPSSLGDLLEFPTAVTELSEKP